MPPVCMVTGRCRLGIIFIKSCMRHTNVALQSSKLWISSATQTPRTTTDVSLRYLAPLELQSWAQVPVEASSSHAATRACSPTSVDPAFHATWVRSPSCHARTHHGFPMSCTISPWVLKMREFLRSGKPSVDILLSEYGARTQVNNAVHLLGGLCAGFGLQSIV